MPFSIRLDRRFHMQCAVTYNAGPFQGQASCGISPIPGGVSQVIYSCDQGEASP